MTLIPELALPDPDQARQILQELFGFTPDGPHLALGTQRLTLTRATGPRHGMIDHLALAVPDTDRALAGLLARGATLDPDVTPDGPLEIPEFWAGGVRYAFLRGPAGARIEIIANRASPRGPGHDHIGIACADLAATAAFLTGLGAHPLADHRLIRPEGTTPVAFLALSGSVVELYQPPDPPQAPGQGLWRRLLLDGLHDSVTGPGGLTLAPL